MLEFDAGMNKDEMMIDNIETLRDYVHYILEQYVYEHAEYRVNISSFTRLNLLQKENEFNNRYNESMSQSIEIVLEQQQNNDSLQLEIGRERIRTDSGTRSELLSVSMHFQELMKDYAIMFDKAMEEIMSLLKTDSLSRFYNTKGYKTMYLRNGKKLQN